MDVMNARMYAVTPAVEALWRDLLSHVTRDAAVSLEYFSYPAPQPLERLWAREDLGAVFMCGFPIATGLAIVQPIASPTPSAPWAQGRSRYRTDLIVRADSPWQTLEDSFGARIGWTVEHSHSGFNAPRHHLLPYFRALGRPLYRESVGQLVTARGILDGVREGRIDIGPLDAYWHYLIAKHAPALTAGVRVLASTELAPMPAFVASRGVGAETVAKLRSAFRNAAKRRWFGEFAGPLGLAGFEPVTREDFALTLSWDGEARTAGYPVPA
jgi:ABC-type phosphate/phosphonate transport system substrate-binding protein